MAERKFLKPKPGLTVKDENGVPLPEKGKYIILNDYWTRRLKDGDVLQSEADSYIFGTMSDIKGLLSEFKTFAPKIETLLAENAELKLRLSTNEQAVDKLDKYLQETKQVDARLEKLESLKDEIDILKNELSYALIECRDCVGQNVFEDFTNVITKSFSDLEALLSAETLSGDYAQWKTDNFDKIL